MPNRNHFLLFQYKDVDTKYWIYWFDIWMYLLIHKSMATQFELVLSLQSISCSKSMYFFFFFFCCCCSFIHMCIHCLGHFSILPHFPTSVPGRSCSALITDFVEKRHKHNKEDKAFLLVKNSYTERFLLLLLCTHVLRPMFI
jgi:hypothetical protein